MSRQAVRRPKVRAVGTQRALRSRPVVDVRAMVMAASTAAIVPMFTTHRHDSTNVTTGAYESPMENLGGKAFRHLRRPIATWG